MIETKDGDLAVAELDPREVKAGVDPNDELEDLRTQLLDAGVDMSPDDITRAVKGLEQAEVEAPAPQPEQVPGWPTFAPGEQLDIKGIWFEVMGMRGGMMYLKPKGPTSALVKRLAKKQGRR